MIDNKILQHYRVERLVGKGGMAEVYLAHDTKFDSKVAIKVLNKEFAHNDNIRNRLWDHSNVVIMVGHLNVLKVLKKIYVGTKLDFIFS
jgi:serine/threonine protein kinase